MSWDFSTEPDFQQQLDWMRDFVRREIWPLETVWRELGPDGLREAIAPLQQEVKARGLWATHLPPELGGQGMGQVRLGLMHEILGTSPIAPLAFGNAAPDSGNSEILALAGTPEQKERWLHPLLAGDLRSAFSMTEPDTPGSDPTQLRTRAVRDGEEWVIDGRKWFSSNGSIARFPDRDGRHRPRCASLRARVDVHRPARHAGRRDPPRRADDGASVGAVRRLRRALRNRLQRRAAWRRRAARSGRRRLRAGAAAARAGPDSSLHALARCGARAFDMMCERATYRHAHGSLLADKQTVQNWIADSAAEMQAARLMTLHAAWVMDTQGARGALVDIALIKFYGAKVLHDVIDRAIQVHGSLGYSTDLPLEQMYRFARAARIYDGPDEVHRQTVARRILHAYAPPPGEVPSEHIPTRREQARERFAELLGALTAND